MRRLIAVVTCHRYRGRAQAIRETWARDVSGADVRFFFGVNATEEPWPDEVRLDVPDDYDHLRHKVQAVFGWAVAQGYDWVFKTDDDVLVLPERLLNNFVAFDYVGRVREPSRENVAPRIYGDSERQFCSGFGYWLSARAARVVAEAPDNGDWAEDRFAGQALARVGLRPVHDRSILLWPPLSGHYCSLPNDKCTACALQYAQASVICPYARPDAVRGLYRYQREAGYIPTGL